MAGAIHVCERCGFENPRAFRTCAACGRGLGGPGGETGLTRRVSTLFAASDDLDGPTLQGSDRTVIGPQPTFEMPGARHDDAPPADDGEAPLVGQDEARGAIQTGLLTALEQREPTIVALEGGPGSGRTRLLFHAASQAASLDPTVRLLFASVREGDGANAPLSRLLLERMGITPASSPTAARGLLMTAVGAVLGSDDPVLVGETAHLLGHIAGIPFPDSPFLVGLTDTPAELQKRARIALKRFIEGDAERRPLVILLDQMHFTEADGWEYLEGIAACRGPIAIVMAGDTPLAARASKLTARGGTAFGPIAPLDEDAVRKLVKAWLPALEDPPEPVVAALQHRSNGNAGALRELLFACVEAGLFVAGPHGLTADLRKLETGAVPVNAEDAMRARIARLSDLERTTLERAATAGEDAIDRGLLAIMRSDRPMLAVSQTTAEIWPNDEDEPALATALEGLVEKGFLTRSPDPIAPSTFEYRFSHAGMREILYADSPMSTRRARHATYAHWITTNLDVGREGMAAMAAPHLERAGMKDRAGRAYLEAAKEELAKVHTQTALRHVERALELLGASETPWLIEAQHTAGSLLTTLGRYDDAIAMFTEMLRTSYRLGARGKGGAALNRVARIHRMRGEMATARTLLERALELFRAADDRRGIASTLDDLAQVLVVSGDLERAHGAATEALAQRRELSDARGEAVSLTTLGMLEAARGAPDAAEAAVRLALEIRERIGDRQGIATSQNAMGNLLFERDEREGAEAAWRAALLEGRRMADRRMQAIVLNNLGEALARWGRSTDARTLLVEAKGIAAELGDRRVLAEIERNLGLVGLALGLDDATDTLERALKLAAEFGGKEALASAHHAVAKAYAQTLFGATQGVDRRAEESFLAAIDLFRDLGNEIRAARVLGDLGAHLFERGDHDGARERLKEARAIFRRTQAPELATVERTLAAIAVADRSRGEAPPEDSVQVVVETHDPLSRELEGVETVVHVRPPPPPPVPSRPPPPRPSSWPRPFSKPPPRPPVEAERAERLEPPSASSSGAHAASRAPAIPASAIPASASIAPPPMAQAAGPVGGTAPAHAVAAPAVAPPVPSGPASHAASSGPSAAISGVAPASSATPVESTGLAVRGIVGPRADEASQSIRPPELSDELSPFDSGSEHVDPNALRERFQRLLARDQIDHASQVAKALVFLGHADANERKVAQLVPDEPPAIAMPVTPPLVRSHLAHPHEDPNLAPLLMALWPAYLAMRARPEPSLGLRPQDEQDLHHPQGSLVKLFAHGLRALALPTVRLFVRTDVSGGFAFLPTSPIASLAGRTLTSGFGRSETMHAIASHLAFYRPETYIFALAADPNELLHVVSAGLLLERRMTPDPRIAATAAELERFMLPQIREALRIAASSVVLAGDPRTTLATSLIRQRRAAHLSAVRLGFVLGGSLESSVKMQRLMPPAPGVTVEDTIDDLVAFTASESWAALRRELGLAISTRTL